MAKLFLKRPGSTDFEIAVERAQPGATPAVEVFWSEEKKKFATLQGLFSLLLEFAMLGAPHLINRFVKMLGDVEAIMTISACGILASAATSKAALMSMTTASTF